MMAAIAAADSGRDVYLLDKNEKLGKKLFITGKGRCNVTNNPCDKEQLFGSIMNNSKFLYSAFSGFDNQSIMTFLERAGCRLKTERGGRVFPVSDHSSDVIAALSRELNKRKVHILLNTQVTELLFKELAGRDAKTESPRQIRGVLLKDGCILEVDRVVVATGGLSYPLTGSDGDGYRFAHSAGHKMVECRPALVPFTVSETWCRELMGLTLKNISVRLLDGRKEIYGGFGELLFTHFGVSGPLILSASSYYMKKGLSKALLLIDLKPALDEGQLDKRILREFEEGKNKQFKNSLNKLFPVKLVPVMIKLSGIDPDKKVNEITKAERKAFTGLIKNLPLNITGTRGYSEAVITMGGVKVKEVNPSTMESRLVTGLYFAGEVLDLDAMTGGFNLQIAWSTGYLAGKNT